MAADTAKWHKQEFSINELSLWDENPRFPEEYFSKSEEDLVEYFLRKKELKIPDFAKEVVNDFDLPQLERIVVLKLDGRNIVLEGNRRLTAYKLLANPSLIKDQATRKFFEDQKKRIAITGSFLLEANATDDKEQGLRYVERKHGHGNNEVGWGEPERRHFAVRRARSGVRDMVRVDLAGAVKELSLPEAIKENVLGRGYVTTFYRIADSEAARKKLGYQVLEDGHLKIRNKEIFDRLLKVIAYNVWSKADFTGKPVDSRSLNKVDSISAYLKRIKPTDAKRVDAEVAKLVEESKSTDSSGSIGSVRSQKLSGLRKHLIDSTMSIPDRRINDIYDELRKRLDVDWTPNAVAVLFRVFLECSVDYYIEKNKIPVKDGIELAGKILKTVDHLEESLALATLQEQGISKPTPDQLAKAKERAKFKAARKVATKDNNSVLSVTTFHDFVHDYRTSPISSELKKHWDNLEGFFVALWGSFSTPARKKK